MAHHVRKSLMTLMQIREVIYCPHHKRGIVVLESVRQRLPLVFYADVREAQYLAKTFKSGNPPCHPLYEFIQRLLSALRATPSYVVLDEMTGQGILGFIYVQALTTGHRIPCYAPNALALALQSKIPIYATATVLAYAEPTALSPIPDDTEDVRQWLTQVKPEDFQPPSAGDAP
jgi:bifunctional DNase/RNase